MAGHRAPKSAASISLGDLAAQVTGPLTHQAILSAYASRFTIDTLRRACRLFDGDLKLFLVFSEIAHYNMSRALHALSVREAADAVRWRVVLRALQTQKVTPCNALSISAATGLPRETVRRKVKELERRGWLVREGARSLTLAPRAIDQMGAPGRALMDEFRETARVLQVLDDAFARQQKHRGPAAVSTS